jgi:hypothetical protein
MNDRLAPTRCFAEAGQRLVIAWLASACLISAGCSPGINTMYGRTARGGLPLSVNGTDVLIGMFGAAGHEVATRRVLITSKLETVDCIVWFPDDVSAPNEETREWFDQWLAGQPGRTLVYVGRDYDAAPHYWRSMVSYAPKEQQREYRRQLAFARQIADMMANRERKETQCEWFKIKDDRMRAIDELSGPWRADVDPANVEIELRDRLVPPSDAQRLLVSTPDVVASTQANEEEPSSQVIVVANGSFLLNEPLVNREHRALAGKLVAAVGPPGKRIVFLESGPGGPPIDPPLGPMGLWRMLGAWPLNVILLHLAAVGIIFCFARWPIFGRPKVPPVETISDFGNHIDAVGQLMRRTRNRDFALARLAEVRGPVEPSRTKT